MVMGPTEMSSKSQQFNVVEILDNDGANWPLWQSKMLYIFESRGLLSHVEGTIRNPVINFRIRVNGSDSKEV
jgi:hypothetical protein